MRQCHWCNDFRDRGSQTEESNPDCHHFLAKQSFTWLWKTHNRGVLKDRREVQREDAAAD